MKSAIVAGVLILVIVGAVIFAVTTMKGGSEGVKAKEKAIALNKQLRNAIDVESLATVPITEDDFRALQEDPANGYKMTKEGRRIAWPWTCVSCTKPIPPVPMPKLAPDEPPRMEYKMQAYKCPLCRGAAYEEGKRPM